MFEFNKPWFGWKKDGSVAQDLGDMTYEEVTWRVRRGSYMYGTWVVKGCGLPRSWASQFIIQKMVRNGFLVAGILSHSFFVSGSGTTSMCVRFFLLKSFLAAANMV